MYFSPERMLPMPRKTRAEFREEFYESECLASQARKKRSLEVEGSGSGFRGAFEPV